MTLSEKYAAIMFNGTKPKDSEIIQDIVSAGFLVALLYEMLDEKLIELKDGKIIAKKNICDTTGNKKVVLDIIITRGEILTIGELVKSLFFSVNSAYVRAILAETEKSMLLSCYIKIEEKKVFFNKKLIYRTNEEVLAKLSQEICEFTEYEDFLLIFLLKKCGLLQYVVAKQDLKRINKIVKQDERLQDSFIITINELLSSISSTLATGGIMM